MHRIIYKTLLEAFDRCDRYGYLKYAFLGKGVQLAAAKSFELAKGSSIHKGVECLWKGETIETAIAEAIAEYDYEMRDMFNGTYRDILPQIHQEHHWIIEGVLRLWCFVRLPILKSQFNFVNAEYKMLTELTDELALLAKPDAIIQSKFDQRFMNWSLKTEKSHGYVKHPTAMIDKGGWTEVINAAMTVGNGDLRNIAGTMMEYLVVGSLAENEPIIWHPTIRGWRSVNEDGSYKYAWRYKYDNPNYDPTGPKDSKNNPQTKSLSAKDKWERFNAADYPGGIQKWIEDLSAQKFHPTNVNPIDEIIYAPEPYTKTAAQVNSFLVQTITEQTKVNKDLADVESGLKSLDETFPQRTFNCLRYGPNYKCEMWGICWENKGIDPLANGYELRKSSSDRELQKLEYERINNERNNGKNQNGG